MRGVYYIKNKINKKIYIGSSNDVEARIKGHFSNLRYGRGPSKMQKDYNRLGKDSFEHGILKEVSSEVELLEIEEKYIILNNSMENGYNSFYPVPRGTHSVSINFTENQYKEINRLSKQAEKSVPSWILSKVKEIIAKEGN